MAHTRKHSRSKHYRRRHHRGGSYFQPASYSSSGEGNAASMTANFGDLSRQSSTVGAMPYSNNTLTAIKANVVPNATSLSSVQSLSGGRRRRGRHSRKGRGGNVALGAVVSQAIVPFSLLGVQNRFGNRGSCSRRRHSRRTRRR